MYKKNFIRIFLTTILSIVLIVSIVTANVFAHTGDYFAGTYTSDAVCNPSYLKFRIESTAQTSLLTSAVYQSAFNWDNISSKVSIGIAMYQPGMSSVGFYSVVGETYNNGVLGRTVPRDANGNITTDPNCNWKAVTICMNISSSAYSGASNQAVAAQKTFTHEVGHALKLAHPVQDGSLSNHIYDGLPRAIMNQGYPDSRAVSSSVTSHDKTNLTAKWGN